MENVLKRYKHSYQGNQQNLLDIHAECSNIHLFIASWCQTVDIGKYSSCYYQLAACEARGCRLVLRLLSVSASVCIIIIAMYVTFGFDLY